MRIRQLNVKKFKLQTHIKNLFDFLVNFFFVKDRKTFGESSIILNFQFLLSYL